MQEFSFHNTTIQSKLMSGANSINIVISIESILPGAYNKIYKLNSKFKKEKKKNAWYNIDNED